MKTKLTTTVVAAFVTILLGIAARDASAQGQRVHSVSGHGTLFKGYLNDSLTIDAWSDEQGNAHGMITWESVLFAFGEAGPGQSGYPWYIAVDTLQVSGNLGYLEGVVVASPQRPEDVGIRWGFLIEDNGHPQSGTPDVWYP